MKVRNITTKRESLPGVLGVCITVHLENPNTIRLYKWPNMRHVGLYDTCEHGPGKETLCEHRVEGTCSPHDITNTEYMVLWERAQTELGMCPLDLLMSLCERKLGADMHDIPKDWRHEIVAAVTWIENEKPTE